MTTPKKTTITEFIAEQKTLIDSHIHRKLPHLKITDHERRLWLANDEELYDWAKAMNVEI